MNYWLSRTPGSSAEGPFEYLDLKAMYDQKQIADGATVCRAGKHEWRSVRSVLAEEWERHQILRGVSPTSGVAIWRRWQWPLVGMAVFGLWLTAVLTGVLDGGQSALNKPLNLNATWQDSVTEWLQVNHADPDAEIIGEAEFVNFQGYHYKPFRVRGKTAFGGWDTTDYVAVFFQSGRLASAQTVPQFRRKRSETMTFEDASVLGQLLGIEGMPIKNE